MKSDNCQRLLSLILESKKIVFFGGAGVSTASGIPDFRSTDGLYNMKYDYPPEEILSRSFFKHMPGEFYRFYREKMLVSAKPNMAHIALAKLEELGRLSAIVTQNIDGLHQKAGSNRVFELHGSIHRNYCMNCGKSFPLWKMSEEPYPVCECGGIVRPDVVLYEEMLDDAVLGGAIKAISNSDLLIIGGTSLAVYPAAGLIHYFNGKNIALINKTETSADSAASLLIHEDIDRVFASIIDDFV